MLAVADDQVRQGNRPIGCVKCEGLELRWHFAKISVNGSPNDRKGSAQRGGRKILQIALGDFELDQFFRLPVIGSHCRLGIKAVSEPHTITDVGQLVLPDLLIA
ncbi:hypothetical protein ACOMDM_09240 [Serratia plymuthica]|uniref:hypothetical protein n=1 Tax=Serratia plymuthica TaxID=82996 RepID=UPI00390C83DD